MNLNPYRIQPTEEWEIEDTLNQEETFLGNHVQLFSFLLQKYLSNFYHGAERFHSSSGSLKLNDYHDEVSNLTFNKSFFTKSASLIEEKLRGVILDLNEMYSISDIKKTAIKNNDDFLSISPFLYDFKTWESLIKEIEKKYYSKEPKAFRSKIEFALKTKLKYLKIDKFWNLNKQVHFFLDFETYHRIDGNNEHIDILEIHDLECKKDIGSYQFQIKHSQKDIPKYSSKIYFKALHTSLPKKNIKPKIKNFQIKLSESDLSDLYNKLEDKLSFFSVDTQRKSWIDILLNDFSKTSSKKIQFTPKHNYQVYHLFQILKKHSESSCKDFYESKKFTINNEELNYGAAKVTYNTKLRANNTFKGKSVIDSIFEEILNK